MCAPVYDANEKSLRLTSLLGHSRATDLGYTGIWPWSERACTIRVRLFTNNKHNFHHRHFKFPSARTLIYGINQINIFVPMLGTIYIRSRNVRTCNNSLMIWPIERVLGAYIASFNFICHAILSHAAHALPSSQRTSKRTNERMIIMIRMHLFPRFMRTIVMEPLVNGSYFYCATYNCVQFSYVQPSARVERVGRVRVYDVSINVQNKRLRAKSPPWEIEYVFTADADCRCVSPVGWVPCSVVNAECHARMNERTNHPQI